MKKTKVLAMLTAVVLLIGMFCICAAAETKEATGCGQQLSLGDDLDMKFYVAADADTTVKVTVDGKTTAYDLRGKAPVAAGEGKGTYEIVVSLTAAQMTSQITLNFKQGGEDAQISSSVREYAEAILGGEHPELTKTLVKHTLNYGAAAQKYFNVNTGSLANSGYELDYKAQLPEGYDTIGVEGRIGGVRIVGATLVFKSKITLRYIFEANSLEDVDFTANGVSYTATEKDGQFFVDIPGINPNMYATNVVLQAVKGEETLAVTYSPMHYIVRMSKKVTTTEPMRALLNAMYGYYEAASAYVADNSVEISLPVVSNGAISANKSVYRVGDTVTLTVAPDAGYSQKLYINGEPLLLDWKTNTYTFVATEESYSITGGFVPSLSTSAKDANRWDTANQAHGILNTYYPANDDSWTFFIDYNYRAATVKVKNYLANEANKGEGTATALGFELSNGKTYNFRVILEKGVYAYQRFGIAKPEGGKDDWTKYELDAAAIAAICGDGADFKLERTAADTLTLSVNGVVYDTYKMAGVTASDTVTKVVISHYGHKGQKVAIPFQLQDPANTPDVQINIPALTNGTVTPTFDSYKIGDTVSLKVTPNQGYSQKLYINGEPLLLDWKTNTYTFVATEESYSITGGFVPSLTTSAKDANKWDTANQAHGIVNTYYPSSSNSGEFYIDYNYRAVTVKAKNYWANKDNKGEGAATVLGFEFSNGKTYNFRVILENGVYAYQRFGIANPEGGKDDWTKYKLDAAAIAAFCGDGVDFKLERTAADTLTLSVNGVVYDTYKMAGVTASDTVTKVVITHYGHKGEKVAIPFQLQDPADAPDVQINIPALTNGTVTPTFDNYKIGDTVSLKVTPNQGYSQKLYVNGKPLLMDWKQNTASFVATEKVCNITGGFEPSVEITPSDAGRFDTANQAHGILRTYYPKHNDSWFVDINGEFSAITVKAKNLQPIENSYEKAPNGGGYAIVLRMTLDNGKNYAFRIWINTDKVYAYNHFGGGSSATTWGGAWCLVADKNADAVAALQGEGADFKLERIDGCHFQTSINGTVLETYTIPDVSSANKVVSVGLQENGNRGFHVEIPYVLETKQIAPGVGLNIAEFEGGKVTAGKALYKPGETVTLKVTPEAGYSQKLYINDQPLKLGWKTNTCSFVATEEVYNITGSFEPVIDIVPKDAGRWHLANQAHGTLTTYYPNNNDSWWLDINGEYKSVAVMAKNYLSTEESKDSGGSVAGYHMILRMVLDNGKAYAFRIYNDKGTYAASCSAESGAVTGWGNWKNINEHAAAITGDGVAFKVERVDAKTLAVSVNGTVLIRYTMEGVTADNKVVSVGINSKGNKGQYVEMPFTLE